MASPETLQISEWFNGMVTGIIGVDKFGPAKTILERNEGMTTQLYNELSNYMNGEKVRKEPVVRACLEKMCDGITDENADEKLATALQELKDNNPHL